MEKIRCSKKLWRSFSTTNCRRTGKFTFEGKAYCAQHLPENVKKRQDASHDRWNEDHKRRVAYDQRRADCMTACEGLDLKAIPMMKTLVNELNEIPQTVIPPGIEYKKWIRLFDILSQVSKLMGIERKDDTIYYQISYVDKEGNERAVGE